MTVELIAPRSDDFAVIVPWVNETQRDAFIKAWNVILPIPNWLIMIQDKKREGCGAMKNQGIRKAIQFGYETVIILDDDCFPNFETYKTLEEFGKLHCENLKPQPVQMYQTVTNPPSRGTPYKSLDLKMPVAASIGFWDEIGDYCAVRQLAYNSDITNMKYMPQTIFGRYFSLCGMNIAFKPRKWLPWCKFIEVDRFDDIWMGWLWQRKAYQNNSCFNLKGPVVTHSRQSNVWANLRSEAKYLEQSETLWAKIANDPRTEYDQLLSLLPEIK